MNILIDIGYQQIEAQQPLLNFCKNVAEHLHIYNTNVHLHVTIEKKKQAEEIAFPSSKSISFQTRSGWVGKKTWNRIGLPAFVRKNKIDILISCIPFRNKYMAVPHFLLLADAELALIKVAKRKISFSHYKKIIVPSDNSKKRLLENYSELVDKIETAKGGISEKKEAINTDEVKINYTQGKEYFVFPYAGDDDKEYILVLKAFSLFKKRQQTNRKLVFTGTPSAGVIQKLESYKYGADVILAPADDKVRKSLLGAAYAVLYPSFTDYWCQPLLTCLSYGVPVITLYDSPGQEYAGEAGLYINVAGAPELAEQMMLLYKDEALHRQLSNAAVIKSREYSWEKATDTLLQLLTIAKGE